MEYSKGMGVEIPLWVITTQSGKKFWNIKEGKLMSKLTDQCLFDSSREANEKLKDLDFGYTVKRARKYIDSQNVSIQLD